MICATSSVRGIAIDTRAIGRAAVRALIAELATFPKPGLVSLVDCGSHADMDAGHFVRSAASLRRYYAAIAHAGADGADFAQLRRLAVTAEVAMLRATNGANTHRGAIFSVGLLAAAAGARLARPHGVQCLGTIARERWSSGIAEHRRDAGSHGAAVTRRHGAGGAQAEAAAGFPSLYDVALPAYRAVIGAGLPEEAAAVQAFFALLATVTDTNLLHRGGATGLAFAQRTAHGFLAAGGVFADDSRARALAAHRAFVARNLSPGGCADLLAACLFVAAVER